MSREYIQFGKTQIGFIENGISYILWFQPWHAIYEKMPIDNYCHKLTLGNILDTYNISESVNRNKEYAKYVKDALEQFADE